MLQITHAPQAVHLDKWRLQLLAYDAGVADVGAGKGHVSESSVAHLLGMSRTADAAQLFFGKAIMLLQIIGNKQILVRDDAFDGRHHHLVLQRDLQAREIALQIRRRRHQEDDIGVFDSLVHIVGEMDAAHIKLDIGEIATVMAFGTQRLKHFLAADKPTHR